MSHVIPVLWLSKPFSPRLGHHLSNVLPLASGGRMIMMPITQILLMVVNLLETILQFESELGFAFFWRWVESLPKIRSKGAITAHCRGFFSCLFEANNNHAQEIRMCHIEMTRWPNSCDLLLVAIAALLWWPLSLQHKGPFWFGDESCGGC